MDAAVMHFGESCDLIIGMGSGVINDLGKILSCLSRRRYFIAGTAPFMHGYACASASMPRDGLKVSLESRSADVIIGDTQILKNAPERMLSAGLGDMLKILEEALSSVETVMCSRISVKAAALGSDREGM